MTEGQRKQAEYAAYRQAWRREVLKLPDGSGRARGLPRPIDVPPDDK